MGTLYIAPDCALTACSRCDGQHGRDGGHDAGRRSRQRSAAATPVLAGATGAGRGIGNAVRWGARFAFVWRESAANERLTLYRQPKGDGRVGGASRRGCAVSLAGIGLGTRRVGSRTNEQALPIERPEWSGVREWSLLVSAVTVLPDQPQRPQPPVAQRRAGGLGTSPPSEAARGVAARQDGHEASHQAERTRGAEWRTGER